MSLGTGNADSMTPAKITGLPANIKDVAAGYASFYYALTDDGELYGWGYRWLYLGLYDPNNGYAPQPTPKALKSALKLPQPVAQISADHMSTHVILTDGTLWGWGDDAMGEVGDGQELDYVHMYNCAWDYATNLWVYHPVQIAKDAGPFAKVWSNSAYDFYDYAMTVDGKLYSWGRNKTGILGNGVYPLAANGNLGTSSNMCATYPNSWDVTVPTLVDPLHVTPKGQNSPCCVANPTGQDCGG
jgi:alpha-tubulin suppressor-like RCC1 family protein